MKTVAVFARRLMAAVASFVLLSCQPSPRVDVPDEMVVPAITEPQVGSPNVAIRHPVVPSEACPLIEKHELRFPGWSCIRNMGGVGPLPRADPDGEWGATLLPELEGRRTANL